ncbi:MAG TPA: hypothetical protein PKD39_10760 [Chitinophagales bacterium]|nr:hypothetical protein [Chitinophagales bacterium]HMZ34655.1 hypothetical protein [Chitinophagales bacterium]HNA39380.1 hypothetical protein [Chitinophagales bacterium]HNB48482.1 hypothetical protein [Chitinophagales bacterium]HNC73202.1 hypothetical protein [Chitinophagales bacterium]
MKKTILFTFVFAAFFAATFMTSCSNTSGPTCHSVAGSDTGAHAIYIDALAAPLTPIRDSLHASVSGSDVTISSSALGRTITGEISASDCNSIVLDSIKFVAGDTLVIPSAIGPGGFVKIYDIEAGGTGTITATGATTKIVIAKGKTNITSPINLTNLNGMKLNLRGTFLKVN